MNTDNVKLLSDADRKALDIVKEARDERTRLKVDAQKKGAEYEAAQLEKKCQEIKQFRKDTSNSLLELERSIQTQNNAVLQKIQDNHKYHKHIVEELVKLVTEEE